MKNIKYTTDGKKVVIIGDLNQTEKIVQEIFVTENGDEIPQGERFVVKNLLDVPVKSWKQDELEKLERRFEKEKTEWETRLKKLNDDKQLAYDSLSARVKWLRNVAKEPDRDEKFKKVINTLADFLSDSEKWIFIKNYSEWYLEKFNEHGYNHLIERTESDYNQRRYDGMRLLSLFGDEKRNLVFKVNDWNDGSGQDKDIFFFSSESEALEFIQSEFNKIEKYSESSISIAKKFYLKLDNEKLRVFTEERKKNIQNQIIEAEKRLKDLQNNLSQVSEGEK